MTPTVRPNRFRWPALVSLAALLLAAPVMVGCAASRRPKRAPSTSRTAVRSGRTSQPPSADRRTSPRKGRIVGDLRDDSTTIPCAHGTYSLGKASGYVEGILVRIRLCAVGGFHSTAPESTPGSKYYVHGARGNVIVNARVSGAVVALLTFARMRGVMLEANSSYRSMRYQRVLCAEDPECRRDNYIYVARPGWSNHQLGAAIDFAHIYGTGGRSCARARATNPASSDWRFLERYAHRFGFRQYAAEAWHWDALDGPNRC